MNPGSASLSFADFWSLRYAAAGGPLTQLLSQRIGAVFAFAACRIGLSPSAVTVSGAMTFLLAAVLYVRLQADVGGALLCLLVLQLGYGLDCADGQLARATGRTSPFGAWLDIAADYFRNLVLGAAVLLWTAAHAGLPLGIVTLAVFTYCTGLVIKLHTLTAMRQAAAPRSGAAGALRQVALVAMDTVTLLSIIAVLRLWPRLLLVWVAAMGLLYAGLALNQARSRLR